MLVRSILFAVFFKISSRKVPSFDDDIGPRDKCRVQDLSRGRAKERSREGGEQKENPATNRARDPRPRPDADDSDDEEYNWNYGYRDRSYREKIDELCKAHPDWNKDSARWESLTKAYPSYLKLSQCFGDRLIEMRIRQAAVHPAVAEKVFARQHIGLLCCAT